MQLGGADCTFVKRSTERFRAMKNLREQAAWVCGRLRNLGLRDTLYPKPFGFVW